MPSKMKRIGWVVEFRNGGKSNSRWSNLDTAIYLSKSDAIFKFDYRCQFYFIPIKIQNSGKKYNWLKRRGLARYVGVYVEVDDG